MADTFIDFRTIKNSISIEQVLNYFGIGKRLRRVNQNSLCGACPLPTHSSKTSNESFSVNTDKNIWACQSSSCASARQGKKGGNILDFVSIMEHCSIRDAAQKLHDYFLSSAPSKTIGEGIEPTEKLVSKRQTELEAEVNKPLSFTLKDIDYVHPYLGERGLSEKTARQFGVGFFPGRGTMSGRIVFEIHNEKGELVAYVGRAIDDAEPKYKFTNGFQKSLQLYNLHRVIGVEKNHGRSSWWKDSSIA